MRRNMPTTRRTVFAATAVASALLLSACGAGNTPVTGLSGTPSSSFGPAATGAFNAADVAFASDMIPHHAQAVEMAALCLDNGGNAEVMGLATAIKGAQDPEIMTMSGWLVGWGKDLPTSGGHGASMPSMSMPGMMTAEQMHELSQASGPAFDRLWVEMMTAHHEGAIAMARTELAKGQNPEAKALATEIIAAQTAEIATMKALAKKLPA